MPDSSAWLRPALDRRLLSLVLPGVLLLAFVLGGLHHHRDLTDHPECAVCAGAHQVGVETFIPLLPVLSLPDLPELFVPLIPHLPESKPLALRHSRAPPQ